MKFTTIYLGENTIEISNSILGKEVIRVNDKIVSSKYSILGANHNFQILENGIELYCQINISLGINGVVYDFYKNGKPIIESPKGGCGILFIIVFFIALIFGVLVSVFERN
jgi:hypothetical protein